MRKLFDGTIFGAKTDDADTAGASGTTLMGRIRGAVQNLATLAGAVPTQGIYITTADTHDFETDHLNHLMIAGDGGTLGQVTVYDGTVSAENKIFDEDMSSAGRNELILASRPITSGTLNIVTAAATHIVGSCS